MYGHEFFRAQAPCLNRNKDKFAFSLTGLIFKHLFGLLSFVLKKKKVRNDYEEVMAEADKFLELEI